MEDGRPARPKPVRAENGGETPESLPLLWFE